MANQIIIDIGAVANDGTGDPLRTAFNYVNNNFSNIWATGVANSNISFSGNKILTTNTNGNLVLAPNGIGKVQANVDIVPNANNTLNLGSLSLKWNTVYAQNLDVGGNVNFNDLTVDGNLTVTGNIIQIGNIVTDSKTIQLSNTAGTANAANGSGITVGANDNIATMLYSSASNVWTTNIGIAATGNVSGTYFIGNGSLLTGIASPYGNANVAAYLPTYTGNLAGGNLSVSSAGNTWTIEGQYLTGPGGAFWHSHPEQSVDEFVGAPGSNIRLQSVDGNSVVESQINLTGTNIAFTVDNGISRTWRFNETGVTEFPEDITPVVAGGGTADIGNLTNPWTNAYFSGSVFSGNIIPNTSNTYSLGNSTNQWSDLYVSNATIFMNGVPISLGAGNVLTVNGEAVLSNDSNTSISTTGNVSAEILTANIAVNIGTGAIGIGDDNYLVVETLVPGGLRPSNDDTYNLGNVSHRWSEVHANVYYGDGSQLTGLNLTSISNDGSIVDIVVPNGDVTITADSTQTWSFGTNGTLTVPGDITSDETFAISSGDDINISGGDKVPGSASSEGGDITIFGGTGRPDNGTSTGSGGDVRINAGDGGDGTLSGAGAGGYAEVQGGSGGAANVVNNVQAGEGGYVIIQGGSGGDNAGNNALSGIGGNVEIYGGTGSFDDANSVPSGAAGHVNLYGGNWGWVTPSGNIYLNTYDGSNFKTLTYDNHGNVTMAPGGGLNFVGSNPGIVQSPDEDFKIRVQDADDDGFALIQQVDDGSGNVLGSTELQRDLFTIAFAGGSAPQFRFNEAGQTEIPGNIRATEYVDTSLYSVSNDDGAGTVELKVISYAADTLGSNIRVAQSNATISTGNAQYTWKFDNVGNLNLPLNGNIVGLTANNNGYLNWFGNSSGDNNGYTTLRLVPDDTREGSDQYLIIDPTAPGHIHIRAGGTQDNSSAQLFLGGENSYFKVDNGTNPNVYVTANSNTWRFGTDGNLVVPNSIYGTNSGSPIVVDAGATGDSLISIPSFTDGGEQLVIKNRYNSSLGIRIETETGNFVISGNSITFPDSTTQSTAYTGATYGDSNVTSLLSSLSSNTISSTANITTTANISGQYVLGNAAFMTGIPASYGNANVADFLDSLGSNAIVTTGNISGGNLLASGYANITGNINGSGATFSGNVTAANFSGNISITGNVTGTSPNVSLVAGSYTYTFDNTGVLSLPAVGGNEGGEINFAIPTANTTLTGPVKVDVYQDRLRFFDGSTNGAYLDLANCPSGVSAAIGYRDIPQISFSANATATGNAAGCHYYSTTAGNLQLTIPDNSNVAFPTGATLTIVMNAAGNVIVAQGTGVTLYMAGSSTTGNRTVGAYGLASVMKVAANTWVISGTGVY